MVARWLARLALLVALTLATFGVAQAQSSPNSPQPLCSNCIGPSSVSVTPAIAWDTVPPNGSLDSLAFTVRNTGTQYIDVYNLTRTCTGISCSGKFPIPSQLTLSPGYSGTAWVRFYHPSSPSSGTISLTATDTSNTYQATGTSHIVSVAGPAPIVSPAPYSSGLYPASDEVVYAHGTPVVGSMAVQRALTLVYNSAAARPTALIMLDISNPAGGPYPSTYQLKVQYSGANLHLLNGSDSVYYTAGTTGTSRVVVAIDAIAAGLTTTRAYPVNVLVSSVYAAGLTTVSVPTRILVNNQSASPYGAGVGIAGISRLYPVSGSYGMLLVDGGGAVEYFDRACPTCAFISPAGESGTLDSVPAGYRFVALDGSYFDYSTGILWGVVMDHYTSLGVQDLTFNWGIYGPASVTDATGRGFTLTYTAGYLSQITDFANRNTNVSVAGGQLVAVTDPDGLADSLSYGANALLTQVKARSGGITNFTYNALLQDSTNTGPVATDYSGAQVRPTVSTVTAAEAVWQPWISGASPATAKGNVTPTSLVASVTDPLGNVTRAQQDRFGLPTMVVDALADTTTITRDTLGQATVVVAPNGHKTVAVYSGYLLAALNDTSTGQYLTYTYDSSSSNRLETVRGGAVRLDYFYNKVGDPGPLGALKLEYAGDTQGSGIWPPAGGDSLAHHFEDTYGRDTLVVDGLGHTRKWAYAPPASGGNLTQVTDAQGYATTYRYNGYGLLATATTPTRGTDSLFYDVLGRTIRAVNPLTGTIQQGYSALGLTRLTDPLGQVYKFDLNAWGLLASKHDLGDTTKADSAWYDVGANTRTVKTRRGDVITLTYDALGRLLTRSGPDFPAESLYYCPKGTCLRAANANGRDSITYDRQGRVTSVVQQMPDGTTRDTIRYTYDTHGRLVSRGSPNGAPLATASWTYNAQLGTLDSVCQAGACASISRDYEMKPSSVTYQAGSLGAWSHAYLYNTRHLPTVDYYSRAPLDSAFGLLLGYDSLGHADTLQPHVGATSYTTRYLTYDALSRVTNDCRYNGTIYCWNEYNSNQVAYTYDAAGNDNRNGAVVAGNRYSTFSGYTLTYDANGAVIKRAGFWTADTTWYAWNALGRLTVVRRDSAGVQLTLDSLKYDALGHRVAKTVNGTTTWFTYDGDQVLLDRSGSAPHGVLAEYGFDGDDLFAVRTPSDTLVAVHAPTNGTVTGLARASYGQIVKRYDVLGTPFGQQARDTGLVLRYKMGSQEYDQETGLYHLGARYYDPQLHRFLSEDPLGLAGGLNLYAYTGSDPINARDPSGTVTCPDGEIGPFLDSVWTNAAGQITDRFWSCYYGGGGGRGGKGGAGAGSMGPGKTCTTTPASILPHSVGVIVQGSGAAPAPYVPGFGAAGSVEGAAALFVGNGGVRFGSWAGGGGMAGGPISSVGVPGGASGPAGQTVIAGTPSLAGGVGVVVSNARGANELGGDFTNYSVSFLGVNVTLAVGSNGAWTVSVTGGLPGSGVSYMSYNTNTPITNGGNGCGK